MKSKELNVFNMLDQYGVEADAFYDGDKLICVISQNDMNFREEYISPILRHYGVKVKRKKLLNEAQEDQLPSDWF